MPRSLISWCTDTWNPVEGCTRCRAGCRSCWALRFAIRAAHNPAFERVPGHPQSNPYTDLVRLLPDGTPDWTGQLECFESRFDQPLHCKVPRRYFALSRTDPGHPRFDTTCLRRVLGVIAATPWHRYIMLTKRPEALYDRMAHQAPLPNLWIGASPSTRTDYADMLPWLLRIPAAGHLVSMEPLLEEPELARIELPVSGPGSATPCAPPQYTVIEPFTGCRTTYDWHGRGVGCIGHRLRWVILGGESGSDPRPLEAGWVRRARDACRAAGVPFYFKQWGDHPQARQYGISGKASCLDGQYHHELPPELLLPQEQKGAEA